MLIVIVFEYRFEFKQILGSTTYIINICNVWFRNIRRYLADAQRTTRIELIIRQSAVYVRLHVPRNDINNNYFRFKSHRSILTRSHWQLFKYYYVYCVRYYECSGHTFHLLTVVVFKRACRRRPSEILFATEWTTSARDDKSREQHK